MTERYLEIGGWQLGLAAGLILINGAISVWLRLGLERRLFIASLRTVVQLLLIGSILGWVFDEHRGPWVTIGLACVMTSVAGISAIGRVHLRFPGIWPAGIISVWASSWTVTLIALAAIIRPEPWYQPQYLIPLLGMILGNALNGISLGLDRLLREFHESRDLIDGLLALGATRWEAVRRPVQEAIRTGLVPIINSMMVVGIVSLPGMMTGQLLGGVAPAQAVRYQIVIMFLIAAATALGAVLSVLFGFFNLFNRRHQFLADRVTEVS